MTKTSSAFLTAFMIMLGVALLPYSVEAQHCPYDGGHMIVVKLTNSENKPIVNAAERLSLHEIDNPDAASYEYAEGSLVRAFLPPENAFMLRYKRQGEDGFTRFCEDCAFTKDGYYAVVLNQSEKVCMVLKPDGGGAERYIPRKFEIRYSNGGIEQVLEAPKNRIYPMCLGEGDWSRFEPVAFKLDASVR